MVKFNLEGIIKFLLLSLIVLAPFLMVIVTRLSGISSLLGLIVSGYKEAVQLIVFLLLLAILTQIKGVKLNYHTSLLLFFVVYSSLHIIGEVDISLLADGARYQFGYLIVFSFICLLPLPLKKLGIDLDTFVKIIFFQTIIVSIIGVIEFFNSDVISILYGIDKDSMNNVSLAAGSRLISVFGNPINFGAFLCVGLCAVYYKASKCSSALMWFVFWCYWLVLAFLVFFTLSRLALIAFSIQTVFIFIFNIRKREIITIIFLLVCISIAFPLIFKIMYQSDSLFERFYRLMDILTYTDNARVANWVYALSHFDYYINWLWGLGVGASNPNLASEGYMVESSYVSILLEFGVIGALLYLLLLFSMFLILQQNKKSIGKSYYFYLLFLIFFLVMSLGNDFHRNFPFVFYFWITLSNLFYILSDNQD